MALDPPTDIPPGTFDDVIVPSQAVGGSSGDFAVSSDGAATYSVLARDILDIRAIAGPKYNERLRQLLRYYYDNFPKLMER